MKIKVFSSSLRIGFFFMLLVLFWGWCSLSDLEFICALASHVLGVASVPSIASSESAPSLILVRWKSQPQVSIQASVLHPIMAVVCRGVTAGLVF